MSLSSQKTERGLDLDDMGTNNIYKVDNIQAMRWVFDKTNKSLEILNLWRHTKLIGGKSAEIISSQHITIHYEEEELE